MIHPIIKAAISKVEQGKFDTYLKLIENTNLGIFINAYAVDGQVLPIPSGYHQSEGDLNISLENEKRVSDIQVGWFGKTQALCSSHPDCSDYKHGPRPPEDGFIDALTGAPELSIDSVHKTVEKYRTIIDDLFLDGLGLFIVHGHNQKFAFTELPSKWVTVIQNNQTRFQLRKEVIGKGTFVPNIWRLESGVREVVGGFII